MIFRAKNSCLRWHRIRAASILSTDSQMIRKWTAPILWQIYLFHLNKRSFLEEGHHIINDLWFILTIAQFIQVGLQQIGLKNMAFSACHTHPICLIWPLVTSTCFLQWKKNTNGFRWLTRTNFWVLVRDFEGYRSIRIEWCIPGLSAASSRSKPRQWRLRQMINNFHILVLLNFIRWDWRIYLCIRWYNNVVWMRQLLMHLIQEYLITNVCSDFFVHDFWSLRKCNHTFSNTNLHWMNSTNRHPAIFIGDSLPYLGIFITLIHEGLRKR
jgi:hypothetical protein